MDRLEIEAVLGSTLAFAALSPAERRELARLLEPVELPAGSSVVKEGASDRDLYFCVSGEAKTVRGGLEVERIRHGQCFGELALILGTPRAATVIALTPMSLGRLSHTAYRELAAVNPALTLRIFEAMLAGVSHRLHEMSENVRHLLGERAMPRRTQVEVRVGGEHVLVRTGTPVSELLPSEVGGEPVVAALVDRKPVSLHAAVASACELEALTTGHWEGQRIYRQSLGLLLLEAAERIAKGAQLKLAHSVGFARRVTLGSDPGVSLGLLATRLQAEMRARSDEGLPLLEELWTVDEAKDYFATQGSTDTVQLFRTWRAQEVPLVSYGQLYVLRMGPLLSNTRFLRDFEVVADEQGLLLLHQSAGVASLIERESLTPTAGESSATRTTRVARSVSKQTTSMIGAQEPWQRALGITSIGAFNRACIEGSVPQLIRVNEGFHEKALSRIADQIVALGADTKVVCIAGPSSSGKTTFIKRLKVQLHVNGRNPIGISLDDYYVDRAQTPRDAHGDYDYEAVEALRLDLLHEHLTRLLRGERVRIARYDFGSGKSIEDGGAEIALGEADLLMLEGIHGLNPRILGELGAGLAFRVFICPLGQLPFDELTRVHSSDLRLLRRIVRDRHTRSTDAEGNILRWPSVRDGERRHIFPFQDLADAVFDSALLYELSVLKVFAERYLLEVPQKNPAYTTAFRLLGVLDRVVTIYPDHVPQTSILREFIGGSGFDA